MNNANASWCKFIKIVVTSLGIVKLCQPFAKVFVCALVSTMCRERNASWNKFM